MQDGGHNSEWSGERVEGVKANGRRIFSTAFKEWLVAQASRPGVSVAALAMRHEINANQLRRWMGLEHLAQAQTPAVLPVAVVTHASRVERVAARAQPAAPERAAIEIDVGDAVVRVHHDADSGVLRMVLQALRG